MIPVHPLVSSPDQSFVQMLPGILPSSPPAFAIHDTSGDVHFDYPLNPEISKYKMETLDTDLHNEYRKKQRN